MPYMDIQGCNVYYEEQGQGIPVVLTAGARSSLEVLRKLAGGLNKDRYRVILWDRANLGRAQVSFRGSRDLDLWSDQLSELLQRLNAAPAYLAAASSGSRVSYVTALRYPEVVKGLFLWLVSGGQVAIGLGKNYYGTFAEMAEQQGMAAVAESEYWADGIKANPSNRDRLLAEDPKAFARTLRRWQSFMSPDDPAIGVTADDLRRIAVPTHIIGGCGGGHPEETPQMMAKLMPNVELVDAPPGFCDEYEAERKKFFEYGTAGGGYEQVSSLPNLIDEWITQQETK